MRRFIRMTYELQWRVIIALFFSQNSLFVTYVLFLFLLDNYQAMRRYAFNTHSMQMLAQEQHAYVQ